MIPRTLLLALALPFTAQAQSPDTILLHGNILTGAHLRPGDRSPTPERVEAIAITSGKITAVGSDATIARLKGPQTEVVDLHGAFAMPGFNDAHVHLFSAGSQKALQVDLDGTHSLAEMQSRIRAWINKVGPALKPNAWIQGAGWDHTLWPSKALPSRADLDAVTAGHPALFFRTDGHILIANSAALAAANITEHTADPAGGKIDRDRAGNATGIIRETPATSLLTRIVPPPTTEDRQLAFTTAIDDALARGVTSVQDFSPDWPNFLLLESLERTGKLHLRISEWQPFDTPIGVLESRRASHPADDPLLHLGQLKAFMDGSLGSRTAALEAPYADDPGNSGIPRYDQATLNHLASERTAHGFQLGFHAIGDRANDMALDAFAAAEQTAAAAPHPNPDAAVVTSDATPHDLRLRIEHAQLLLPADFDRFAQLGVIASMQPSHLLTDMNWATARLGPDRAKYSYAWHTFLEHGVTLAFGTDYPVESINPFRGLYAAVTRQNEAGTQTYQPQERISIREALYAYTQAPAFAEFREHTLGRLEPGFFADITVLDRDPLTANPQDLLHTRVLRTFLNGKTVFSTPAASAPSAPSSTTP